MKRLHPHTFGSLAAKLHANEYRIVPAIAGEKRPAIEGFLEYHYEPGDERKHLDCGVAIRTGATVAIDIDVREARLAEKIETLVKKRLGNAPVRIGKAPKRLLIYRAGTMWRKMRTAGYRLPGDAAGAKPHQVEVLADGQIFIAYGIHPETKKPYAWSDGEPLTIPFGKLPEVARGEIEELLYEIDLAFISSGGGRVSKLHEADRDHQPNERLRGDRARVLSALESIPNDDLDYDDWVYIGLALKGALGR